MALPCFSAGRESQSKQDQLSGGTDDWGVPGVLAWTFNHSSSSFWLTGGLRLDGDVSHILQDCSVSWNVTMRCRNTEDSYNNRCRLVQALTTKTTGSTEQRLTGWAWGIAEEPELGWLCWKEPGSSHQPWHMAGAFLRSARRVTINHPIVTPAGTHLPLLLQPADRGIRKQLLSTSCCSYALTKDQACKARTELINCFWIAPDWQENHRIN